MLPKTAYIAGPMRGIKDFNFPAFFAAERNLQDLGWRAFNPARIDLAEDPDAVSLTDEQATAKLADYMRRDLPLVCEADAVVVLPGWENSQGANLEVHVARVLGKPVLAYPYLDPVPAPVRDDEGHPDDSGWLDFAEGKEMTEDPETGARKEVSLARFDLIPVGPLLELAKVYGYGAAKYAPHNFRKGYVVSKGFAALFRHAYAALAGQDRDPESRRWHLAHVAWHCLAIMESIMVYPDKDDRYKEMS